MNFAVSFLKIYTLDFVLLYYTKELQLTRLNDMVHGGESLLHCGGDGPEHEDEGKVHPAEERPPKHPRVLVPAGDVEGDGVEALVGPGDGQELLPPPRGHVRDVETQNEGERNHV